MPVELSLFEATRQARGVLVRWETQSETDCFGFHVWRGAADQAGTPTEWEAQARKFADDLGVKFGHLVHPVRAALTGTNKGPGLFDIVYLLGKERCVQRLRRAASASTPGQPS